MNWANSDKEPSTLPVRADAWLFAALAMGGGDPVNTVGAADHLNATIPSLAEWTHAFAVLGERGLIESDAPLPCLTAAGDALMRRIAGGSSPSRATPRHLFDAIANLPIVAEAVVPSNPETFAHATQVLARRFEQWWEEEKTNTAPHLRDAWLLASLHRRKALDWRHLSIGTEDGLARPTAEDWHHAIAVLSKRGLVDGGEDRLTITKRGDLLVESCVSDQHSPFQLVLCVLDRVKEITADYSPIRFPSHLVLQQVEHSLGWGSG